MKNFLKKAIIYLICFMLIFSFSGCKENISSFSLKTFLLDTIVTITLYDYDGDSAEVINGCFELCRDYEKLFSRTVEGSDIYKINHSGGSAVEVDSETALLLNKAIEYCELSEGMFDITVLPLSELWNFKSDDLQIPSKESLTAAAKYVDYTQIKVKGNSVSVPDGVKIDFGAIAKGYIADRVAEFLTEKGVKSATIDLGGNIYALGDKQGESWKIGIRSPFNVGETVGYAEVKNKTLVTSGSYERCFEKDGVRYHHILDTDTGMPVNNGVASVTIIADCSADADALSTTCFVLGKDRGLELLNSLDGVFGVYVMDNGEIFASDNAPFILGG